MQSAMKWMLHSREEFALRLSEMQRTLPDIYGCSCGCHGDLERAIAYFYCLKAAQASYPRTPGNFRSGAKEIKSLFNPNFDLEPYRQQLVGVVIEKLDFEVLMRRYDKPDGFIYLDPPYVELGTKLYDNSFGDDEHMRLRDVLADMKALWLLSYNDHPLVRELYTNYPIMEASWSYNMTAGKTATNVCRDGAELIITNYEPMKAMPIFGCPNASPHDELPLQDPSEEID